MEPTYYTTIGLEIHAELKTKSKMFCGCKNDPDETIPNKNICPVCTAQPGALPVINKEAVKQVVRVGLAVGATIAEDFTEFDRKNYFYPDIPKGYQISQYKYPIVSGGRLADFAITRIHLEEDTGNSKHDRGDFSLVDFNRAGVPLMELVTDAHTFNTADEAAVAAGRFAREYQLLLWYLGASEANMEKGEMRVEANISVSTDPKKWGTKVEVKNLNSIRSAERAIRYETLRMIELIEAGRENEIIQETRGWDENKQATFSQRSKEDSQEYRYFPDPDLPKLVIKELFDLETLRKELPELPDAKRIRYKNDYGIKNEDIETFVNDPELGKWYETVMQEISKNDSEAIILIAQIAANFTTSDYLGIKKANPAARLPSANYFAELVTMFYHNEISSRAAKDILVLLTEKDFSPKNYASEHNLLQKNDEDELKVLAQKIINENETVVATYKAGKENAIMSLVGKIIKETGGSANPQLARQIFIDLIK